MKIAIKQIRRAHITPVIGALSAIFWIATTTSPIPIKNGMGMKLPPAKVDIEDIRRKYHAAVREEKGKGRRGAEDAGRSPQ